MNESEDLVVRNQEETVGLNSSGRKFGNEFDARYADRAGNALFLGNALTNVLGDSDGRSQKAQGTFHVKKGLVQTQGLHERCD